MSHGKSQQAQQAQPLPHTVRTCWGYMHALKRNTLCNKSTMMIILWGNLRLYLSDFIDLGVMLSIENTLVYYIKHDNHIVGKLSLYLICSHKL